MLSINPKLLSVEHEKADEKVFIVSYPKSGRTWLRVLLSRYKQKLLGIDEFHLKLHALHAEKPIRTPQFIFYHARSGEPVKLPSMRRRLKAWVKGDSLEINYPLNLDYCNGSRVVFLIRDPRDTIVSYFHQLNKRTKDYRGSLSKFLRDSEYGIRRLIHFMNTIEERKKDFAHCFVRYEDLHSHTDKQLERILNFANIPIEKKLVEESVIYATFENMRKLEVSKDHGVKLTAPDPDNPDSFKVRKGEIGSYQKELRPADIAFLETVLEESLHPSYASYKKTLDK